MIDFYNLAEDYLSDSNFSDLVKIKNNKFNESDLEDWLNSEIEEEVSSSDLEEFKSCIFEHAEYLIEESKQEAIHELRSSIDSTIEYHCDCLEDHELAAVFAEYVTAYLNSKY